MQAPLPENETARLNALWACRILDTPPAQDYDDIARLASDICSAPIAAITLIDNHRQQFKSGIGLDLQDILRDHSFCAHTILQRDALVIHDLSLDPRSSDNPFVTQPDGKRFYAGVPIFTSDGFALGSLCVMDFVPRNLTDHQLTALHTLSRQVGSQIELRRRIAEQDNILAERDQALTISRLSEARLNEAQRIAHMGSWEYDVTTETMWRSEEQIRIMGFDPDEPAPSYDGGIARLHPEDAEIVAATFKKILLTGGSYKLDMRIVEDDGSIRWLRSVGHAVLDIDGHIIRIVGTMIDKTKSKHIAEELAMQHELVKQSHHQLRLALQSGRFGTWVVDAQSGAILDISGYCKEHFGFAPDANVTASDLQSAIHPDDRQRILDLMAQTVISQQDFAAEYRCVWPNGSEHWIASYCCPLYAPNGELSQFIGITQEITERKRMEQERELALLLAEERADRDPLTGLLNHRSFQKKLEDATERAHRNDELLMLILLDLDNFKFFNEEYGHSVGDEVLRQLASRLQAICSPDDVLGRFGGDEFAVLLPDIGRKSVEDIEKILQYGLDNISYTPKEQRIPIPITVSFGTATYPEQGSEPGEIIEVAERHLRRSKSGSDLGRDIDAVRTRMNRSSEGFSMLDALVTSVDNKDRYTRCHSEDVMGRSLQIGRALGLDEQTLDTIAVAALLHDVGKIGVPDNILRKPGPLTDTEFEVMKKHPMMGAIMVETVPGLSHTLDAVRHHHERWDGRGYPAGLAGKAIPLIARIMAVADAFSAMTMDRPYRKGMDVEKASTILRSGAGIQWDPECVDAFFKSPPGVPHVCE